MHYTLLLHFPELAEESLSPELMAEGQRAFASYAATLHQAGVLVAAEVLQPSSRTTTLRMVVVGLQVQEGPFADTNEQLAV